GARFAGPPGKTGGGVDGRRADQYALACVAFTALTGSLPFARGESMAVLWAHVYDPPPSVTSYRRDLPGAVDLVLARALAKAPGERYPSCTEFTSALRAALDAAPSATGTGTGTGTAASFPTPPPGPGAEPPPPLPVAAATLRPALPAALRDQPTAGQPAGETRHPAAAPYPPRRQPPAHHSRGA